METVHFQEEADLTALRGHRIPRDAGGPEPASLARLAQDPRAPLAARLAAGTMLAVTGDPRLTDDPELLPVPGGTVEIGLPLDQVAAVAATWRNVGVEEDWIRKEAPAHVVTFDGFLIGAYPVTNHQYRRFLQESGYGPRPRTWYLGAYPWDRANHPVAGVDAADADAYAAWLAGRTGLPMRLPREAEWEYAAKGPDGRDYPWGNEFDATRTNTRESGIHLTTPVGIYPTGRSPFGIWDMAGNVEEYVSDHYLPYPGGEWVADHLVEALGTYRVSRGGSFARYGDLARTRRRHGSFPSPLYPCGFRVACDLPSRPETSAGTDEVAGSHEVSPSRNP